MLDYL